MPTGYTEIIERKPDLTFEEFALRCARNFGALVMMRDDPLDAPIPARMEPAPYYAETVARLKRDLADVLLMSEAQCQARADDELREAREGNARREAEARELASRYAAMRSRVSAWQPPTLDHEGLKRFMLEQIDESLPRGGYVYREPENRLTGAEWRQVRADELSRRLERAEASLAEEVERANGRNAWVDALRGSLGV
jgi:hypothetical protein